MMTVMMNAATNRCRMLAWMREPEWKWHIVHTDWMGELMPRVAIQQPPVDTHNIVAMGCDLLANEHNGPNAK